VGKDTDHPQDDLLRQGRLLECERLKRCMRGMDPWRPSSVDLDMLAFRSWG